MTTNYGRIVEPKDGRFLAYSYLDSNIAFGIRFWGRPIGVYATQRKAANALRRDYLKRTHARLLAAVKEGR